MPYKPSKKSQKEVEEAELNITSLMDAFTIILVFLIKQYGTSAVDIDSTFYRPPSALSRLTVDRIMALQISERAPGVIMYRIGDALNNKTERKANGRYPQLRADLKSEKALVDAVLTDEKLKGAINIVGDRDITYQTVVDVMTEASVAGFYKLKLVAQPPDE
jgi:biopolymer transport protein ExbD